VLRGRTIHSSIVYSTPLLLLLLHLPPFLFGTGAASFRFRGGRPALVCLPFPFAFGRGRDGDVAVIDRHQVGLFWGGGGGEGGREGGGCLDEF